MPVVIHPEIFAQWLDIKNVDAEEAAQFLKPAPEDYFVFEPTVIERTSPPPKPKPQLTLF
jgi:putative SOS response-associated peptidase YedK